MNPNIAALQFAERELRDHDRRTDELAKELKELKKTRAALAARVQECIDVLCGKVTPDLFADVIDEPQADGGLTIVQCPKCLVFGKPGRHECAGSDNPFADAEVTYTDESGEVVTRKVDFTRLADLHPNAPAADEDAA